MRRARGCIFVSRCERGHVHAPAVNRCPECGARSRTRALPGAATLVLAATVRVNPAGEPFRLGVAVTRAGRVRVLCRVERGVRANGVARVVLEELDGVVTARPAHARR